MYLGAAESVEYNSRRKNCGRPPSKPGIQETSTELLVWLESEQFRTGNGFPVKLESIDLKLTLRHFEVNFVYISLKL